MRAVGYTKVAPIEAADALVDFEARTPRPRDRLAAIKAASVNRVDKARLRAVPPAGEYNIPGYDAAGRLFRPATRSRRRA